LPGKACRCGGKPSAKEKIAILDVDRREVTRKMQNDRLPFSNSPVNFPLIKHP
jgi:hypothetical protein